MERQTLYLRVQWEAELRRVTPQPYVWLNTKVMILYFGVSVISEVLNSLRRRNPATSYCNFSGAVMYVRLKDISSGMSEVKPLPYVSGR